jgi:predicted RNA-binding protein with PIN domain
LLRAVPPYKKKITDKERVHFIAQLGAYGRKKGHKIVIVFDGGPYEWPQKEQKKIVLVVYSGIHATADDYIKEYIESQREKDLLLVSSDTELNQYAQRLSIPSIDSISFAQLVRQELVRHHDHSKYAHDAIVKVHESASDIDALMIAASTVVPIKSDDFVSASDARTKKAQVSKHERILLKKLNKL